MVVLPVPPLPLATEIIMQHLIPSHPLHNLTAAGAP
jgi:hypothetical protein